MVSGGIGNPTTFTDVSSSSGVHHDIDAHQPFALAKPTAFADADASNNLTDHGPGYNMGVKHIAIPKSMAPQPAVSMQDPDHSSSAPSKYPPVDWGHAGSEYDNITYEVKSLLIQD